jgi:predicted dehydrogenase
VVDLAHYLAGPIVSVNALTRTYVKTRPIQQGGVDKLGASEKSAGGERAKVDVDDEVVSMLRFESGTIGSPAVNFHQVVHSGRIKETGVTTLQAFRRAPNEHPQDVRV